MTKTVYSFRIAYHTKAELQQLQEGNRNPSGDDLVLSILENGQPSYKTLYCSAFSEADADRRVDDYVSITPYREIVDGKMV